MFQHKIRVSLLAMLAAGVLALSGCGGGSSKTASVPVEPPPMMECPQGQVGTYPDCMDPPPTDAERIAAAQGRAGTAATNARADANAAMMLDHQDDAAVMAAVEAADVAADAAELARDLANAATNPDAAEALATQAETAEGNADTAYGNAMTASTNAQTAMEEAARIAATSKAAKTKEDAIAAEGKQGPGASTTASDDINFDAGLGGSAHRNADGTADNADDPYRLSIKRDRMATTIKITDLGMMDEDEDPQFMQAMDMMDGRTMHVRDNGKGVEEVVIVSTDIEAPTGVAFAKWEAMDGTTPQALDVMSDDGAAPAGDEVANALDIAADTDLTGDANSNLMFARSTMDGTLNYSRDNPGTEATPTVDEGLHDGTYNGADGTYRCTLTTGECTVSFNDKGGVVGVSDGWVFVPDEGATSDQSDYDYLNYGFWLMKTTKDGAVTYNEVETFAGSSVAKNATGIADVEGTASYKGGAVGVYVHAMVNADGSRASATSGHFKADANLTASFGGDDVAVSQQDMLTGTIDKFVLSGGEANTWSVALKGAIDPTSAEVTAATPGTAKGGGNDDGKFTAQFHGLSTATVDGATVNIAPHTVVGEFNSYFTNGSVAGAFGAREVKED